MNTATADSLMLRILIGGACLVVIVAGMRVMAPVLNILFLAWLLAFAIRPLPDWMIRKRVPETLAVLSTLLVVIIGGIAITTVMSYSIISLSLKLPAYQSVLAETYSNVVDFLAARNIDITQSKPLEGLTPSRIFGFAGRMLGQIGNLLGDALMLIILVAILLFEFLEDTRRGVKQDRDEQPLMAMLRKASVDVGAYVSITSKTGVLQAVINVIVYMALGIDFAVTWGVLFFFMNFVPVIGGFVAMIPPVTLAFIKSGWLTALAVLVLFTINNLVWDNVLKPKIMGKSLNLPFLLIILSVVFWSWVLGSVGTILAVPLTMVVRNLYYMDIAAYARER